MNRVSRSYSLSKQCCATAVAVLLVAVSALAGTAPPAVEEEEASIYDRIWDLATLYEDENNPVIQSLVLSGRAQADAAFFDGIEENYEAFRWRRFRFGFKASLFGDFTLHSEADFDFNDFDTDDLEDVYGRFTDFYLGWSRDDRFKLKVGKQSAPFTLDGATSSKKLITLERSHVAANFWFPTEYFTGVGAAGEIDEWSYHTGIYSSSGDDEFGSFDSGYFGLISVGYEFAERTGADRSLLRADYVYNDPDYSGDVGTRDTRQVLSLVGKYERGDYGLWTDVSFADGIGDQGDLFGLQVMPFYDLSDELQLVFRYTYVTGDGDGAVRLNRYEDRVTPGRADEAHEFFLGLNWYLYGHKLKWQNGVEYISAPGGGASGGDYDGWGFTSGIRVSW